MTVTSVLPIELMNTIWADRQGIHDSLATFAAAHGLPDESKLRELRDALRRLAAHHTGDPRDRAATAMADVHTAIRTVNGYAQVWPVLDLTDDGTFTTKTHGDLLGTIAAQAVELFGRGEDVRACLGPGCVLYFLKDHPRQEWCSAGCGNRARAARHYARHGRTTTTD